MKGCHALVAWKNAALGMGKDPGQETWGEGQRMGGFLSLPALESTSAHGLVSWSLQ